MTNNGAVSSPSALYNSIRKGQGPQAASNYLMNKVSPELTNNDKRRQQVLDALEDLKKLEEPFTITKLLEEAEHYGDKLRCHPSWFYREPDLKTIANLAIDNLKGSDPTNPTDSEQPLEAELEPKQRKQTLALVPNRKTAVRRWAEEELVVKQKELSEAALVYTRLQLEVSALTTILEMV